MSETEPHLLIAFLLQISAMLAIGLTLGQLMRKLHQPAVLGELLGGIVLGPTILGFLFPDLYHWLFPADAEINQARDSIIRIGILFFMFVAGLEVNLAQLQQRKQSILLVSLLGCLFPFALGIAAILLFPDFWNYPTQSSRLNFILFIGIALSISALPVITRILMDLRLLQHEVGGIVITSAALNDLIGWALFALLFSNLSTDTLETSLIRTFGLTIVFTLSVLVVGRWLGQSIFRWARITLAWPSGFLSLSAVFIFTSAAIAESMSIHAIFGAFLIGVALFPVFEREEVSHAKEIIHQFAISLFAPLYFVSVGLKADFIAYFDWQLVVVILVLATVGKVSGAGLGAWLSGMKGRDALAIGVAMNARGAMEMILAALALEAGLIGPRVFVALVTMALLTSMMSGPGLQWLLKIPHSDPTPQ